MLSRAERLRLVAAGSALMVSVVLALVAVRGPGGGGVRPAVACERPAAAPPSRTACRSGGRCGRRCARSPSPYGLRLGTAVNTDALANDPPYAEVVAREFGTPHRRGRHEMGTA